MSTKNVKISIILCALIFLSGVYFIVRAYHSHYKSIPAVRIAIVDGARLKKEAQPFLDVAKIIQQETEKINNDINKKRENLKKISKKSKDPSIPIKKRAEYRKQFEREFVIIESEVQKRKDTLKQQCANLEKTVSDAVMEIIQNLAKKYNLNLILNTKVMDIMTVFYASQTIDLTNEAIDQLNKTLKNISIN